MADLTAARVFFQAAQAGLVEMSTMAMGFVEQHLVNESSTAQSAALAVRDTASVMTVPSIAKLASVVAAYGREHPLLAPAQAISAAIWAAPGLFLGPVFTILGFGTLGPVAGSLAANIQSTHGVVAAGSWFAFGQSAGMGGTALSTISTTAGTVAGFNTGAVVCYKWVKGWISAVPERVTGLIGDGNVIPLYGSERAGEL